MSKLSKFETLKIAAIMLSNSPDFVKSTSNKNKVTHLLKLARELENRQYENITYEEETDMLDIL